MARKVTNQLQKIPNADNITPSRRGKKGMTLYLDPGLHRMLKQLALDKDTSVQALLITGVHLILGKHGRNPIT